jgi:hypothetical protein
MTTFFLVTQTEFCETLDSVQDLKLTVTIPVRWTPILDAIEDEEEPPVGYELEDGEIYESNETKNRLAAAIFMASLLV